KLHSRQNLKCGPVKDLGNAVKAAGDKQTIGGRVVEHSLGLGQIGNGMHTPARLQVDHFERVVVNSGHEEALTFHVDAGVIDATFDVRQRNMGLKRQRRWFLPGRDRKSTRLNSSHVSISYAVFCLKKKKT